MKKILLLIALILFSTFSFSQISIIFSDMPQIGDTVSRNADTMTTLTPGPAGANQSWVMTNTTVHVTEVTKVLAPSSTPYAGSFSTSNISFTNDNQSYLYFNQNSTTSVIKGAAGDLLKTGCNITTPFNPDMLLHNFPRNYASNFSDAYGMDVTVSGSCVNQSTVDQVRFKRVSTIKDTTDAWGTITTPVGTYQCLRVKRVDFSVDSTWVKGFFPFNTWNLISTKVDTSYSYVWLAKEGKLAIAEMSFDSLDNPKKFTWSLIPPNIPLSAGFMADVTSGCSPLVVIFSDQSAGNPTNWKWNIGNGNNSTLQNPGATYVTPGTYSVTLIVGNGNTFDTIVKPNYITVFANPTANFSDDYSGGNAPVTVNFSDNSTPGSGAINSWFWDFGDGFNSTQQNPSHPYASQGNFTVSLIVTDINGCTKSITKTLNIISGVSSINSNNNISFFPNPASEKIYFSGVKENSEIMIFDITGRVIQSFAIRTNSLAVDVSKYPEGIYFYQLKEECGNFLNKGKFAVAR